MKRTTTALAAISVAASLVVSLSGCSYFYPNWGATGAPTTSASASSTPTDSASPTVSPSESASPSSKPKQAANINIMNLSNDGASITAIAEITNVSEDGGQCKLTVTGGAVTKSVVAKAESNVSTTQCYSLSIPLAFFSAKSLTAVISYESDRYVGSSSAVSVPAP